LHKSHGGSSGAKHRFYLLQRTGGKKRKGIKRKNRAYELAAMNAMLRFVSILRKGPMGRSGEEKRLSLVVMKGKRACVRL